MTQEEEFFDHLEKHYGYKSSPEAYLGHMVQEMQQLIRFMKAPPDTAPDGAAIRWRGQIKESAEELVKLARELRRKAGGGPDLVIPK